MEAAGERIVYFGMDVALLVALAASPSDSEKKIMCLLFVCVCLSMTLIDISLVCEFSGLEGFRQIGSFIVVREQLIVCVQYVDILSNCRREV